MLSAQVDRLRELATRCNELQVGETRVVRVPSDMGSILSEAADTIWQLRDDLQQANTENAKLIVKLNAEHIVRQNVEIENAKLRELVKYAHECAIHSDHATCDDCERMNGCCILVGRMSELGVEADA